MNQNDFYSKYYKHTAFWLIVALKAIAMGEVWKKQWTLKKQLPSVPDTGDSRLPGVPDNRDSWLTGIPDEGKLAGSF